MSFIVSFGNSFVSTINQPEIKQNIKNIAGIVTLLGGVLQIGCALSTTLDKKVQDAKSKESPRTGIDNWTFITDKQEAYILKASLLLSAVATPVGNAVIGKIANAVFGPERLVNYFGPNTIFAVNPMHPRHVVSLLAAVSSIPSVLTLARNYFFPYNPPLTYSALRKIAFFNFITSRPLLHIVTGLAGRILRG